MLALCCNSSHTHSSANLIASSPSIHNSSQITEPRHSSMLKEVSFTARLDNNFRQQALSEKIKPEELQTCSRLIHKVVNSKQLNGAACDHANLIKAGQRALMLCIESFNGIGSFIAYARKKIRAAIMMELELLLEGLRLNHQNFRLT